MQQIRYFLTLSKTLNFTRAAQECNVSQSALTRAIQAGEESNKSTPANESEKKE